MAPQSRKEKGLNTSLSTVNRDRCVLRSSGAGPSSKGNLHGVPAGFSGMEDKKSLDPEKSSAPRFHRPGLSKNEIYNRLFSELKRIPNIHVKEQQIKIDICGENVIEYHEGSRDKPELTLISLFKPTKGSKNGVRFYVFPYILATHLYNNENETYENETNVNKTDKINAGENKICALVPTNIVDDWWREGHHRGDRWINGFFTNEEEVEKFLNGIQSLYDRD